MSPPSSTATVTGGAGRLPSLLLVAADFEGGWSGCSEKSVGVKSSRTELSDTSRFLYAAWTSLGPIGTSRGTGFPGCGPAIKPRQWPRPMQYDAFHQSPQCRRRFRPDYSSWLGRRQRAFREQFVISASQLRNDMRLVQCASVGNCGNRAD